MLFGPWLLLWLSHRKRVDQRVDDQARWADLTHRVHLVEQALQSGIAATPAGTYAPEPETPRPEPIHVPQATAPIAEEPRPIAPPPMVELQAVAPPPFAAVGAKERRFKSALDVEEKLGTNWLNKLGIGLLVLGLAFLISYQLKNLGPAGKVRMGYALSGAMLALGIWFERKDRYRILARAAVGGGWALLFFTTYAMYFVPAAHVIESQLIDLVLLLAVAAAMVLHTLRYRSQVVTGLAFLLAFLTVSVSHSNVYSLGAGAVLAAGLVVIVGRMQWFELEVFGIAASYLNHYLWLRPIIEPMKGHRHPFAEFPASAAILALYWAIFRVSYVWRRPTTARQERISTVAALLNTVLMLLLFKYQSTHPEWAFWALLAIGGLETAIGQLPITRRRRTAVVVLSTLGVVLLIAAFPFRYSGLRLSVLWLLEAEALLLIGVWTREVVFRRLGALVTLLVAGQMISVDAARVCGVRMDGADGSAKWQLALLFLVAACVFMRQCTLDPAALVCVVRPRVRPAGDAASFLCWRADGGDCGMACVRGGVDSGGVVRAGTGAYSVGPAVGCSGVSLSREPSGGCFHYSHAGHQSRYYYSLSRPESEAAHGFVSRGPALPHFPVERRDRWVRDNVGNLLALVLS